MQYSGEHPVAFDLASRHFRDVSLSTLLFFFLSPDYLVSIHLSQAMFEQAASD